MKVYSEYNIITLYFHHEEQHTCIIIIIIIITIACFCLPVFMGTNHACMVGSCVMVDGSW